jgi:hypothetical protein
MVTAREKHFVIDGDVWHGCSGLHKKIRAQTIFHECSYNKRTTGDNAQQSPLIACLT